MLDWLVREGGYLLSWWVLVTLAGVAAFPLVARLLSGLPDKGYALARAAGLLVIGFVFWLLASLGALRNTPGSMVLSWLLVLVVGIAVYRRFGAATDWRAWLREHRGLVLVVEVLFLVLFVGWALYRAHNPELRSTEKPMEMMMLNSVLRSAQFPPHDAWMSGYSISYYYFGYVIAAMLTMLSGAPTPIGFNLMVSLLFALTGVGAFGVVYNLVRSRQQHASGAPKALLAGGLATFFTVLMGNGHLPIIELPWQTGIGTTAYFQFWDVQERDAANPFPVSDAARWNDTGWWWFRASRVVQDRYLPVAGPDGTVANPRGDAIAVQPIDEFPQFSFILADMHPHVLALPFVMLALGLGLNVLLTVRKPSPPEIVFYGVCLGGLVFLNAWDGPIYIGVLVGAEVLRRLRENGRLVFNDWVEAGFLAVTLAVLTVLLYAPFFISFRSQASGILPNLIWTTPFPALFVTFAPFLLLLPPFLATEAWRGRRQFNLRLGLMVAGALLGVLVMVTGLLVLLALVIPAFSFQVQAFIAQNGGINNLLLGILTRRISPAPLLTLLVLLGGGVVIVGCLFPVQKPKPDDDGEVDTPPFPANSFVLLLIAAGLVLVLVPEFFYLRDNFGVRINTIFKFYYQAWVLFSIAAAYGVYSLLADDGLKLPAPALRRAFGALLVGVLAGGALYPALAIFTRALDDGGYLDNPSRPLTLDGGPSMMFTSSDYTVLLCLNALVTDPDVVVVEGIGGAYWVGNPPPPQQTGRIGAVTGIQSIMGWDNHERQWRGALFDVLAGTRLTDIPRLYQDLRWDVAQEIIVRYGIDYILYTPSERVKYGPQGEQKFIENLPIVCQDGLSTIYRVTDRSLRTGQN